MRFIVLIFLMLGVLACAPRPAQTDTDKSTSDLLDFVGCYSVTMNAPADIVITHDDKGFFMQMYEADGTLDTPEPLQILAPQNAWEFYQVNALGLNASDIIGSIGRADSVLILSKIKEEIAAINPYLDSVFVVNLLGSVNTIYAVPCAK